jgi:hypothetical protein
MHDLLMESAFEPDLLVRRHWTLGDFGLCRFKSRQKRPARQLVLNFSAGMKFPGLRTAARAEPGLSARDQNAGIKQAAPQYREVQHALEIGSLLQTSGGPRQSFSNKRLQSRLVLRMQTFFLHLNNKYIRLCDPLAGEIGTQAS